MASPLLLLLVGAHHSPSFPYSAAFLTAPRSCCPPSRPHRGRRTGARPGRAALLSTAHNGDSAAHAAADGFDPGDARDYFVKKISENFEALGAKAFSGFGGGARECVLESGNSISEKDAADFFTRYFDQGGNYMNDPPHYDPEAHFAAIHKGRVTDKDEDTSHAFARQNVIVGVASAQLRRRAPLVAGPANAGGGSDAAVLPSVSLPSPHVYVANMKVDCKMRRRGVGMALLSSVMEYAKTLGERMDEKVPLVLSVDSDNVGGLRLYEKFGFDYLERNGVFCVMVLWP